MYSDHKSITIASGWKAFSDKLLGGQYPTSIWEAGDAVVDRHSVTAPPGEYQVYVGLYQWETSVRLPVALGGEGPPEDRLSLGVVKVP